LRPIPEITLNLIGKFTVSFWQFSFDNACLTWVAKAGAKELGLTNIETYA